MKKLLSLVLTAVMLTSMLSTVALADDHTLTDVVDFLPDEKPALEDNFFAYVNWDTIKQAEIPVGKNSWTVFVDLDEVIKEELNELLSDVIAKTGTHEQGTSEQKIADLYASHIDVDARNAGGLGSLAQYIERIENAATVQEYVQAVVDNDADIGADSLIGFSMKTDTYDSAKYSLNLSAMELGGLDQNYLTNESMSNYWSMYTDHIANLFVLFGMDPTDAAERAAAVFALEQDVATNHTLSSTQQSDKELTYNPVSIAVFDAIMSNIDVVPLLESYYSEEAGRTYATEDVVIISDLQQAAYVNKLLVEENLPLLKDYSLSLLLLGYGYCLTMDYRAECERYDLAYSGTAESLSLEEQSLEDVKSMLKWNIGEIYAANFFKPEYKADIEQMVQEIITAYHEMIDEYDWMSDETKAGAHAKLDSITARIAYPDDGEWPEHRMNVDYNDGLLIDNILKSDKNSAAHNRSHLGQPVVSDWNMAPQTVNASYGIRSNTINFPAGIFRGAFYDPDRSHAANLGAIGAVIAHEISHAFDNKAALYDAEGNYRQWWTDEDLALFKEKTQAVADFYSAYEVWPAQTVDGVETTFFMNGEETNSENIGDLGALSCISHILGDDKEALREAFLAWAGIWAGKMTYGKLNSLLLTDSHGIRNARVNRSLSTTDAFYYAFDIQEGDGMWVAPEDRVKIW